MRFRRFGVLPLLVIALVVTAVPVAASGRLRVLLEGLNSPKALAPVPGVGVLIGQGGYGPPGDILLYHTRGPARGTTEVLFKDVQVVDLALTGESAWAIGGDHVLYFAAPDGTVTPILDIPAYQDTDPDPYNDPAQPDPTESNPFGLAALPNGDALVADAAGNDIIRVTQAGDAWTVARWTREEIAPGQFAEAVPTSIAIGRKGWIYVGQLTGAPAIPKTSHIWRVNPDANGAVCDVNADHRNCSVWRSGFTSIMDLAIDRKSRTTYVYEIAAGGWLAFEEGFPTLDFPPAVLKMLHRGERTRLVPGQLSQPGSVVVMPNGNLMVSDGMFTGGRLLKLRMHD
jgi:hypothetical protein